MKKLNFSNHVSLRNKSFLRYLLPLCILLFSINGMQAQSQQVLGSFPSMDGGFEGQSGTIATGTLATGVQTTAFTQESSGDVFNSNGRTGLKSVNINQASTSTKRLLISPTAANGAFLNATQYTIQFYYRTPSTTAPAFVQIGASPDGTLQPGSYVTATLTGTSNVWTKFVGQASTGTSTLTPRYGVGLIRKNTGALGQAFDVDDFVIYPGTTDVTAPDAPTVPSVTTSVATQMTVSWTAPVVGTGNGIDGGGYMVVRYTSDPTGQAEPNVNGIYSLGSSVGTGVIVYLGTNTSIIDMGLSPLTQYFYRIYSVDKAFNYSTSISSSATTSAPNFAVEPTAQVSGLNFTTISSTGFTINWTPDVLAGGTNHLIVVKSGSDIAADPIDGSSYTASTVFGTGSAIGGGTVVYNGTGNSVAITGLSKAVNYFVRVYDFNGSGGTENYIVSVPASSSQLASPGEIVSNGSSSAGKLWSDVSAWVNGIVPGASDNVNIVAGDKIQVPASASCFNLTVQPSGKLYNNVVLPASTQIFLTVFGNTVNIDGTFGDKVDAGTTDCALGINFNGNLTINGSGTLRPCRIRPNTNTKNATLTVNADMTMTYQGGTGTGGAAIYTDNSGNDNITITLNSGKTLNFLDKGNLNTNPTTTTNSNASTIINVNGIMNLPINSNLSLPVALGKTCALNVNGTLNVGKLNATSSTGGAVPTINVSSAGLVNISGTADFSSPTLSANVTGAGSFILGSGATISVAAPTGLEPVAGPVRTTTRTFDPAANYSFVGTAAQVTGSDLPSTVNSLTINNAAGVALSAPTTLTSGITLTGGAFNNATNNITLGNGATVIVTAGSLAAAPVFGTTANLMYNGTVAQTTSNEIPSSAGVLNNLTINNTLGLSLGANSTVNGILTFTAGKLSLGANNLTIAPTGSIAGNSAANYIVTDGIGKLTQSIGAGASMLFPVGASATSYDPATLTPTDATDVAVNVGTTLPDVTPSNYTYNAKVWDISSVSPSSTVVTLTPSTAVSTIYRDVIGHYTGGAYDNVTAVKSGNGYTATFSTFSPFVTGGVSDLGTSLSQNQQGGISFDGQTIHNNTNVDLQVFDTTGRLMVSSNKNINMSNHAKGIYIVKSTSGSLKIAL
ncbi:MAG: T9SS type A sorting domain-containing protein [Paludibacter sp.]|nr:T9SS type A sorting domain-containing protein [Paludibacter sp.]